MGKYNTISNLNGFTCEVEKVLLFTGYTQCSRINSDPSNQPIKPNSMRKISFLLILLALNIGELISQTCLPQGITFTNQSMIDDFQINYPDCNIIEGKVRIHGNDISNLDGLSSITGIEDDFEILENPNLTSLSGLSNLTYLGNDFWVEENPLLTDFSGLSSLTSIEGDFGIYLNNQLINFQGLDNLTSIGFFNISSNENLEDLSGLSNLNSVDIEIIITQSSSLTSLSGLENVTSSLQYFVLQNNPILTDITAAQNIDSIGSLLAIMDNSNIDNLTGLKDIKLDSLDRLWIKRNPSLSECAIQNICTYLTDSIGDVIIEENAIGCNNQEEVIVDCHIGIQETINSKIAIIYPNPAKDYLIIETNGKKIEEVVVYNEFGQKLNINFNKSNNLDLSNLEPGIYILELRINTAIIRKPFVISN